MRVVRVAPISRCPAIAKRIHFSPTVPIICVGTRDTMNLPAVAQHSPERRAGKMGVSVAYRVRRDDARLERRNGTWLGNRRPVCNTHTYSRNEKGSGGERPLRISASRRVFRKLRFSRSKVCSTVPSERNFPTCPTARRLSRRPRQKRGPKCSRRCYRSILPDEISRCRCRRPRSMWRDVASPRRRQHTCIHAGRHLRCGESDDSAGAA